MSKYQYQKNRKYALHLVCGGALRSGGLAGDGTIKCKRCGDENAGHLQIDHINGVLSKFGKYYNGGGRHGRGKTGANGAGGFHVVKEVLNMHYAGEDVTKEFQALCANCHYDKTRENNEHRSRDIAEQKIQFDLFNGQFDMFQPTEVVPNSDWSDRPPVSVSPVIRVHDIEVTITYKQQDLWKS